MTVATPASVVTRQERMLRLTAMLFAFGFAAHNLDHVRRGIDAVTPQVMWLGTVAIVPAAVAIALVLARHPLAATAAVAVGFPLALGVSAVHLLPDWGVFSDSLVSNDLDLWSWIAVLLEIGTAAALGVAGADAKAHAAAA